MPTKKELITENYLILTKALEEFVEKSLLPTLDDLDIVDIMYLLKHFFPKEKTQDDYIAMINFLISEKEIIITDDEEGITENSDINEPATKEEVSKLIDNIPLSKKNQREKIDIILDGGLFNGSYLIGALYFLREMEKVGYVEVDKLSG